MGDTTYKSVKQLYGASMLKGAPSIPSDIGYSIGHPIYLYCSPCKTQIGVGDKQNIYVVTSHYCPIVDLYILNLGILTKPYYIRDFQVRVTPLTAKTRDHHFVLFVNDTCLLKYSVPRHIANDPTISPANRPEIIIKNYCAPVPRNWQEIGTAFDSAQEQQRLNKNVRRKKSWTAIKSNTVDVSLNLVSYPKSMRWYAFSATVYTPDETLNVPGKAKASEFKIWTDYKLRNLIVVLHDLTGWRSFLFRFPGRISSVAQAKWQGVSVERPTKEQKQPHRLLDDRVYVLHGGVNPTLRLIKFPVPHSEILSIYHIYIGRQYIAQIVVKTWTHISNDMVVLIESQRPDIEEVTEFKINHRKISTLYNQPYYLVERDNIWLDRARLMSAQQNEAMIAQEQAASKLRLFKKQLNEKRREYEAQERT